jgi:hypothetical protein
VVQCAQSHSRAVREGKKIIIKMCVQCRRSSGVVTCKNVGTAIAFGLLDTGMGIAQSPRRGQTLCTSVGRGHRGRGRAEA